MGGGDLVVEAGAVRDLGETGTDLDGAAVEQVLHPLLPYSWIVQAGVVASTWSDAKGIHAARPRRETRIHVAGALDDWTRAAAMPWQ